MQGQINVIIAVLTIAGIAPLYGSEWPLTGNTPNGHRGPVTALIHKGDTILSAGEDGFLETWNIRTGSTAVERFQVSPYSITAMAERPGRDEVCLVENDGLGLCRVSAWNYKERRNIFTLRMRDPVAHVFYSATGKFIIAAGTGRNRVIFIDSATGATLQSPQSLSGTIGLAVTGKSERNMLVYFTSGILSYWNLETENETNRFDVSSNLYSPVLFSNSRYFAGVNAEGLAVINAVTGETLARDSAVPDGAFLCPSGDELFCIIQKENAAAEVYRYSINRAGNLIKPGNFPLSAGIGSDNRFTVAAVNNGAIVMGTSGGSLILSGMNGRMQILTTKEQIGITDTDVSGQTIAFLAENETIGFIPLDYNQLSEGRTIRLEQNAAAYTHITAFAGDSGAGEQFIFWQDRNTQNQTVIRSSNPNGRKITLFDMTFRSPIRSADSFGGKILFLDSTGNLSVVSPLETANNRPFTFFSVGLMDGAFIDRDRLIIGRSAVSGNTPFMMININTGETVPLPYASQAGVTLYRGASGAIYAAAVSIPSAVNETEVSRTLILKIDTANIAASRKLVDFEGEDAQFSLAELSGSNGPVVAATLSGEKAAIYAGTDIYQLERTAGLPLRLINGGLYLISLDRNGNICWHDSHSGKLLAIFRLHGDGWALQTERRTISGKLVIGNQNP